MFDQVARRATACAGDAKRPGRHRRRPSHTAAELRVSGVKRTWLPQRKMSANDPKRTSTPIAPAGHRITVSWSLGNPVDFYRTAFELLCAVVPQWCRCQWCLCRLRAARHAVRGVLCAARHAVRGVLCAAHDAAPSRSSGPRHLTPLARWLVLQSPMRLLVPEGKTPFDAKSVLI